MSPLIPLWLRGPARILVMLGLLFSSLYLVCGEDGAPGGPLFALLLIFVASSGGGTVISKLGLGLPPLLGMLISGFLARNLPYIGERVGGRVNSSWSSALRLLALALILCRAGLGMDIAALRRLRFIVLRLALLPCLTEAAVIAVLASALLDFPLPWAAMLGFVVAAVSPAVVVPSLLNLQDRGYGVATGIPTMVVAAAALDDVFSIAGFGICLGFAIESSGGNSPLWLDIARAPLELLLGTLAGAVAAGILVILVPLSVPAATPAAQGGTGGSSDDARTGSWRSSLLFASAVTMAFGLKKAGFSGASALAVLVLSAGVAVGWGAAAAKACAATFGKLWNIVAQPMLFGLVGAAVSVKSLEARVVGIGLVMLVCSVSVRCGVTSIAVLGRGLRWQERLFAALAWMPKATVQAAVGAIALDEATNSDEVKMGREVLAIAVLSILCTAPLGAVAIAITGPKLLILEASAEDSKTGADG